MPLLLPKTAFIFFSRIRTFSSMATSTTAASTVSSAARLRGVVFDMDGTLTVPVIDFPAMYRAVLGEEEYRAVKSKNPSGIDILHHIESWSPDKQRRAYEIIADFEKQGLDRLEIMPGASELCCFLESKNIKRGLITRNVKAAVDLFHQRFGMTFAPALSREFRPYKPDPAPLLHICATWDVQPNEVMMIGDSLKDDVACGKRAGAFTCLLDETGRYDSPEYANVEFQPDYKEHVEDEAEEEEGGRFESGAIRHLSMLHLNSAAKHRPKCTACGGSMKRSSPSFPSSLPEPSPKRVTLLPPSSSSSPTTAAVSGAAAFGSKQHPSPLYRSLSEPIDSLGVLNIQTAENLKTEEFRSVSAFGQFLNSLSPENSKIPVKNSDSRPPIPPLHRSFSDPTAALEFQPPAAPTPPRPSVAAQTIKSSPEESPNTKRLKRMKERLRQMRQWWDQVLQEEDEHSYSEDNNSKEEEKGAEPKTSPEESVWVEEKAGEGLVIHFKCPCNKGYEILLSGNNCYYKLM